MGLDSFNRRKAIVVLAVSFGVALASYGELNFVFSGFIFQCLGSIFEETRLVEIQKLLQGLRMDPVSPFVCARKLYLLTILQFRPEQMQLVSLYYYAPVCLCRIHVRSKHQKVPRARLVN